MFPRNRRPVTPERLAKAFVVAVNRGGTLYYPIAVSLHARLAQVGPAGEAVLMRWYRMDTLVYRHAAQVVANAGA